MQKMMDALVKPERAKGLILTQVPVPEPGIGEVLIKIHKTAYAARMCIFTIGTRGASSISIRPW